MLLILQLLSLLEFLFVCLFAVILAAGAAVVVVFLLLMLLLFFDCSFGVAVSLSAVAFVAFAMHVADGDDAFIIVSNGYK